jgi:hypothetical protein
MAAGLGFKTFVTGEVLTAGDTNGYLMQGVNVFASAAARTSAITSPQEGQMSYLKDTDATEYYTGAAWTAVGAPSLTLLSTTALSGTSTTVSSISQSYTNLFVYINNITFSASAELNITIGGTSYYNLRSISSTWTADNAVSKIRTSGSTVAYSGVWISIPQYSTSAYHTGTLIAGDQNNGAVYNTFFWENRNGAVSSVVVTSAAGTATMSAGNIYVYGVK